MYLKTRYTLSLKFVLAQVRGNNHWSRVPVSQVQLKILNYRTLKDQDFLIQLNIHEYFNILHMDVAREK